jgi:hypothetical protein
MPDAERIHLQPYPVYVLNQLQMPIVKLLLFFVSFYIYLYNPIFQMVNFGLIKILLLLSMIYLVLSGMIPVFFNLLKKEILFGAVILFWLLITLMWGEESTLETIYTHVVFFLEAFIIPLVLIRVFHDVFDRYGPLNLVIWTGLAAALITTFLVVNPSLNTFVRESIIIDNLDTVGDIEWDFRGFSIAESSSYAYGMIQGIMVGLVLYKSRQKASYLFMAIPMIISVMFNARIGFFPVLVALVLSASKVKGKNVIVLLTVAFMAFWMFSGSDFVSQNNRTLDWALSLTTDTSDFLKGKSNDGMSNYDLLFGSMLFFPETIWGFIFGEGRNVYMGDFLERNSDIGYVIQIFVGGAVYLGMMLAFLYFMFRKSIQRSGASFLPLLFVAAILIANMKGNAFFLPHGFFRLFTFFYIYWAVTGHEGVRSEAEEDEKTEPGKELTVNQHAAPD